MENDTDLKLIQLVERFPNLYSKEHGDYKNRTAKDNSWFIISREMNIPVNDCQTRWTSICGKYSQEINKYLASGSGTVEDNSPIPINDLEMLAIQPDKLQHTENPNDMMKAPAAASDTAEAVPILICAFCNDNLAKIDSDKIIGLVCGHLTHGGCFTMLEGDESCCQIPRCNTSIDHVLTDDVFPYVKMVNVNLYPDITTSTAYKAIAARFNVTIADNIKTIQKLTLEKERLKNEVRKLKDKKANQITLSGDDCMEVGEASTSAGASAVSDKNEPLSEFTPAQIPSIDLTAEDNKDSVIINSRTKYNPAVVVVNTKCSAHVVVYRV